MKVRDPKMTKGEKLSADVIGNAIRVARPEFGGKSAWGRHSLRRVARVENCQCGADAPDEEGERADLGCR